MKTFLSAIIALSVLMGVTASAASAGTPDFHVAWSTGQGS
jgi:hypothetical protein